jgi:hypothetical protein
MKIKALGWTLVGVGVALAGSQLVPVDTSNPPADGPMALPEGEVGQILRDACMDCHSHETVWPWYAHVTPVKFLVAGHVKDGRRALNFSTWAQRTPERQDHKLEEVVEMVESGEMPEGSYTWMHAEARLTDAQRHVLVAWAQAERALLQASGAAGTTPDSAAAAPADTTVAPGGGETGQR